MRKLSIIFIATICLLTACKKEKLAPTVLLNEMTDTVAVLKYSGTFESGPYGTVTGKAEIYQTGNNWQVKLADFLTNNGPALHVYISREAMPVTYIDLGELKSVNGNQLYDVTGMPDFMAYKYISIHCVAYNHLFGYALLQ
ncbi:MAG: DM13 domain-containing protein [Ferruginibacter sp.]